MGSFCAHCTSVPLLQYVPCGRWQAIWQTSDQTDVAQHITVSQEWTCKSSGTSRPVAAIITSQQAGMKDSPDSPFNPLHRICISSSILTDRWGIPPPSVRAVNQLLCGVERWGLSLHGPVMARCTGVHSHHPGAAWQGWTEGQREWEIWQSMQWWSFFNGCSFSCNIRRKVWTIYIWCFFTS